MRSLLSRFFFFLNDPAPPEISPLPLPAALPIFLIPAASAPVAAFVTDPKPFPAPAPDDAPVLASERPSSRTPAPAPAVPEPFDPSAADRKSTRLNSSHLVISYAVFCLKKKQNTS